MNLHHLKYFCESVKLSSVTAAAKSLHVSQSAVSRAIQCLEDYYAIELIVHKKRRFQVTDAGAQVFSSAQQVFDAVSNIESSLEVFKNNFRGPLTLACSDSLCGAIFPGVSTLIANEYPDIELKLLLGGTEIVQQHVRNGEADIGVVVDQGNLSEFYKEFLLEDSFVVVRNPNWKPSYPVENLVVARLNADSFSTEYLKRYKAAYSRSLPIPKVLPSWLVCKEFTLSGNFHTLLPRFIVKRELESKQLTVVRQKVPLDKMRLCTITRKNRAIPKNAQPVVEAIQNLKNPPRSGF